MDFLHIFKGDCERGKNPRSSFLLNVVVPSGCAASGSLFLCDRQMTFAIWKKE